MFDVVQSNGTSLSVGASQTGQFNLTQNAKGSGSTKAGASSVTMSWTSSNSQWVDLGVSIRMAGVTPGQLISGSYVGNGIDRTAISGQLGFEPDAVFIKGETTQEGVVRTATMSGDLTKQLAGNKALAANMVESLDGLSTGSQGGFTVGGHATVNSNVTYDYVALTAKAGEVFMVITRA